MVALVALIATLHLFAKDNGHLFTVKPQTPIVVTLVANPSTGYAWKYQASPGGERVVTLVSQRYYPPKKSRPGAPGKEVWHFEAIGKGAMDLGFRYARPFGPSRVARKVGIAIRVR